MREQLGSGVGVLATSFEDGKSTLLVVVTDDLRERGVRADQLIKPIAAAAGGRGGGKPHMAQAGIPDASRIGDALAHAPIGRARGARRRRVTVGDWLSARDARRRRRRWRRAAARGAGRASDGDVSARAYEAVLATAESLLADAAWRSGVRSAIARSICSRSTRS